MSANRRVLCTCEACGAQFEAGRKARWCHGVECRRKRTREAQSQWYHSNRERARANAKAWRLANLERFNAIQDRWRLIACGSCGKPHRVSGLKARAKNQCATCWGLSQRKYSEVPCCYCGEMVTRRTYQIAPKTYCRSCYGIEKRTAREVGVSHQRINQIRVAELARAEGAITRKEALARGLQRRAEDGSERGLTSGASVRTLTHEQEVAWEEAMRAWKRYQDSLLEANS